MTTPTSTVGRRMRALAVSMLSSKRRARLRSFYESATTSRSRATAVFVPDGEAVRVTMLPASQSFRLRLDSQAGVESQFLEPREAAALAAFVREASTPGVLFDVGANNGLFSLLYCLAHGANRSVAFEPSQVLCRRMEDNARLNGIQGRNTVVMKAVAERSGSREVLMRAGDQYVQVMEFKGTGGSQWCTSLVETTTLDLECTGIEPSLVKIDVEGYEWEVLQGASATLERVRPVVFLELHLNFLEERRVSPTRVLELLTAKGYELFDLSGARVSSRQVVRSWASVLHLIARPNRASAGVRR